MIPPTHLRRILPFTIGLLVILALFTPIRYLDWVGWFGSLSQRLVAPISHPLSSLARWLAPAGKRVADDDAVRVLEESLEEVKSQMLREMQENARLQRLIDELNVVVSVNPKQAIRQVYAPVYGSASDMASGVLSVRAGRREGVEQNTVATAMGLQLLGKVVSVTDRTCTVVPITAKASGQVGAMVMLDNSTNGLFCRLEPTGNGTLRGQAEHRRNNATAAPIEPVIGQAVRLSDTDRWPRSAQMLIIGTVEAVEPAPGQPLRSVITVRPTVADLTRVSEVLLRISAPGEDSKPSSAVAAPPSRQGGTP